MRLKDAGHRNFHPTQSWGYFELSTSFWQTYGIFSRLCHCTNGWLPDSVPASTTDGEKAGSFLSLDFSLHLQTDRFLYVIVLPFVIIYYISECSQRCWRRGAIKSMEVWGNSINRNIHPFRVVQSRKSNSNMVTNKKANFKHWETHALKKIKWSLFIKCR